ncbi:hypothetical protein QN277_003640 [Acacia crassicarpa]|uniref:PGG domain-containing protein n=1 Tax=Acacia crassicarpa TaxID=499986 RepID=A0AAE1IYT5_9FABA|nr:hypothetical protein QN277_003640 [Acacia crassicarpa]
MAEALVETLIPAFKVGFARTHGDVSADVVAAAVKSAAAALMGQHGEDVLSGIESYLSVVGTLIATITFTAGFTLPGGLNQDKGSPILKYNAAFIAFVITDSLSLVLSTSAVLIIFFAILGEKFKHDLFKKFSRELVVISVMLIIVAMGLMIIAFGTGIYAVLGVSKGFGVVTLVIVLSFFVIVIIVIKAIKRMESERMQESKSDGIRESDGISENV